MAYQYDVFISYRREEDSAEWTQKIFLPKFKHYLQEEMGKKEVRIFIDQKEIEGGQYQEDTIKLALAKSKCLVPVLMTSYFQSEWCAREFAVLHNRQEKLGLKPKGLIIPFKVWDGESFPEKAQAIQSFNCVDYYFTQKGFLESASFFEFQKLLKTWIRSVAKAIKTAPTWDPDWTSNDWLDIPIDDFLLGDDLDIQQPHNIL